MNQVQKSHLLLLALVLLTTLWSVIGVEDTYLTWILEASPALVGLVILVLTYNKFKMPTFLYVIIALHMAVLLIGDGKEIDSNVAPVFTKGVHKVEVTLG